MNEGLYAMGKKLLALTLVMGLIVLVGLVVGCDTFLAGDGNGGNGGGADVPLGTQRIYQDGDTWNYALTGTYTQQGGGIGQVAPATATVQYEAGPFALNGIADLGRFTVTIPVDIGYLDYTERLELYVQ